MFDKHEAKQKAEAGEGNVVATCQSKAAAINALV